MTGSDFGRAVSLWLSCWKDREIERGREGKERKKKEGTRVEARDWLENGGCSNPGKR